MKIRSAAFGIIKHAVAKQFESMKGRTLYRVDLSGNSEVITALTMDGPVSVPSSGFSPEQRAAATGDRLWEAYLASFPEGTNPVYKERTDHDCSCCKHFIRTMGGVVAIVDGKIKTLWDFEPTDTFYDAVSEAMDDLIVNAAIDNIFLHTEKQVGVEKSFAQVLMFKGEGRSEAEARVDALMNSPEYETVTWEHFHLHLPANVVMKKDAIGPKLSETRSTYDVFKRGLEELTLDAVDTVLELIAQNSLYRGEEHVAVLEAFRKLKLEFEAAKQHTATVELAHSSNGTQIHSAIDRAAALFVWSHYNDFGARIRNTAIGTLLQDLSGTPCASPSTCLADADYDIPAGHTHDSLDLEDAVRKFEKVMAPANYKRPTALVTKAMIVKAQEKVEELGYASALERRYATIDDITVNNILFADRRTTKLGKKNVFEDLAGKVPEKSLDKMEEISIEKFLSDVLPKTESLEVMMENRHGGNLVSLIAPVDPGAKNMFKWPNRFSWSYSGDVADSIKERVKKAGGNVTGDLCCRLVWDYTDDLDFHMKEPDDTRIYYGNVRRFSASGGMLDLDANGRDGMKAEPVENIFYADKKHMKEGVYQLSVNNYARRSDGKGFEVEIEFDDQKHNFVYEKALRAGEFVHVADIAYSKKDGFKIQGKFASTQSSKTVWNVSTMTFQKVNVVMLSPNYWDNLCTVCKGTGNSTTFNTKVGTYEDCPSCMGDGKKNEVGVHGVGNKHYFFMLDGCRNEERARGFYNEFLSAELEPHRKTMEMVGAKMKTDEADRQLSGLGFSSTQRSSLLCRVKGSFQRTVKVVF